MSVSDEKALEVIFKLAAKKKEIPYSELCSELGLSEEDMEDTVSNLILNGSLHMKLDQTNKIGISLMDPFELSF